MRVARYLAAGVVAGSLVLGGLTVGVRPHSAPVVAQEITVGQPAFVNVPSLTVRSGPGLSYPVVTWLDEGTSVYVVGGPAVADGYDWFQLTGADGAALGWSVQGIGQDPALFTYPEYEVPEAVTTWLVTDPFMAVRAQPDADSASVRIETAGTVLTQEGDPVDADGATWIPVAGGWIGSGEGIGLEVDRYPLYVSADALNVRVDPSLSGEVVGTLTFGDTVNVYGSTRDAEGNGWSAVNEDETLWVSADWVTVSLDEATSINAGLPDAVLPVG
jgi:uncharacterized protein YgiM (DUF1202 family)